MAKSFLRVKGYGEGIEVPMPLLIDAFNVLHTSGVLPPELAGLDLARLIALVQISRYRRQATTLVCDGRPQDERAPSSLPSNVGVRYSGQGRTADDVIAALIDASSAPRRLIVISSDHAIIRAAKRRACKALRSERFLEHLLADATRQRASGGGRGAAPPARPKSVASGEVEDWLATFNADSNLVKEVERTLPEPRIKRSPPATPAPTRASESAKTSKRASKTPRSQLSDRARRGGLRGEAGGLPQSLIEQAEQLWKSHQQEP